METLNPLQAWVDDRWASGHALAIDRGGRLASVEGTRPAARGIAVPGMHNLHSHAFQRAMAGRAERRSAAHADDSFWTWREQMYALAGRVGPDEMRAIAAQLYAEMLQAGYTSVCEFHYVHHDPAGRPYADPAAMSRALVDAARDTGIGLMLLPVLYLSGGFDGRPLQAHQRRFGHDIDSYLALMQSLGAECDAQVSLGVAFHSLRAVPADAMRAVLSAIGQTRLPVHLHIAEQQREVEECVAIHGRRPVRWLLDEFAVDDRWTLVHATHLEPDEITGIAGSGATVALCPSTEANLGDGFFPLADYIAAGGAWGIGSDSHVSVSPVEELRWLEYGQRLLQQRRNVAASDALPSTGESLYAQALAGGERSSQRGAGRLRPHAVADMVLLDPDAAVLAPCAPDGWLDGWIFSGNRSPVDRVWAGGRRVVAAGVHVDAERHRRGFAAALSKLRD